MDSSLFNVSLEIIGSAIIMVPLQICLEYRLLKLKWHHDDLISISLRPMNNTDLNTGTSSHKTGMANTNLILGWVHGWILHCHEKLRKIWTGFKHFAFQLSINNRHAPTIKPKHIRWSYKYNILLDVILKATTGCFSNLKKY